MYIHTHTYICICICICAEHRVTLSVRTRTTSKRFIYACRVEGCPRRGRCAHSSSSFGTGPLAGGVHDDTPRQNRQHPHLQSQRLHRGVCWPRAHRSDGMRSHAMHQSQNLPVNNPQSAHGRHRTDFGPTANTSSGSPTPRTWMGSTFDIAAPRTQLPPSELECLGQMPTDTHTYAYTYIRIYTYVHICIYAHMYIYT